MAELIRQIIVVIPARNEAQTLGACLASVARACEAARTRVRTRTVLVLDSCTDDSARVACRFDDVMVLSEQFGNVGEARARGVMSGLRTLGTDPTAVWIATTDADSAVSPRWLLEHVRAAHAGAEAYVGSVVPVLDELDEDRRSAWFARHSPGATLGHVHGANLGVRADVYLAAGGFMAAERDEDVALVSRLRRNGARIVESEREPVITSSRLVGRVERGYAQYLRDLVTPA